MPCDVDQRSPEPEPWRSADPVANRVRIQKGDHAVGGKRYQQLWHWHPTDNSAIVCAGSAARITPPVSRNDQQGAERTTLGARTRKDLVGQRADEKAASAPKVRSRQAGVRVGLVGHCAVPKIEDKRRRNSVAWTLPVHSHIEL